MLNTNRSCCLGLRQQLLFSYRKCGGCPIIQRYRTSIEANMFRLSDSSVLSDNHRSERVPVVRFIEVIGQPSKRTCSRCPIQRRYRTTFNLNVQNTMVRRGNWITTWNLFISRKKRRRTASACWSSSIFLVLLNILSYFFEYISSSDSMFFLPISRFSKNIFKNSLFCFSPW